MTMLQYGIEQLDFYRWLIVGRDCRRPKRWPESLLGKRIRFRSRADYTQNGRKMVEYFTRVRSETTNALFFARLPAERLDDFKTHIDPIIFTLQIP
jgi:hypothetical protein